MSTLLNELSALAKVVSFLVAWLLLHSATHAQLTRYDARSAEGQKMLKIYAAAVAKMQMTMASDPNSWTFQWYTHSVRGDSTKANEINAVFGANMSDNKTLAQAVWETCQAHHDEDDENNFLVWHRMYVNYFEQIIRDVSGDRTFTLPYWNYSENGQNHGVIPPEFTLRNDPNFSSLYVAKRNPGVNMGQPIDNASPGALNLDSLKECSYEPVSNSQQGFNMALDQGLHGSVHVLVGNDQNMGQVPWAAGDPIFWLAPLQY